MLLTGTPEVTLPTGQISRWHAISNPALFTFQVANTTDYAATIEDASGLVRIRIQGDVRRLCVPNDPISFTGALVTFTSVITIFQFTGVDTIITTNETFTTVDTGTASFDILPVCDFRIYDVNAAALLPYSLQQRSDGSGTLTIDISDYLRSARPNELTRNYATNFQIDGEMFVAYYIQYKYAHLFSWTNSAIFYGVIASKQIADEYGQVMGEYNPFKDIGSGVNFGKFLSAFKTIPVWVGYPHDVTVLLTSGTSLEQVFLNANKQTVTTSTTAVTVPQDNAVKFNLDVTINHAYIDFWLDDNGLIPPLFGLMIDDSQSDLLLIDNLGTNFLKIVP